jgi:peptide/nickel transport system permease protein
MMIFTAASVLPGDAASNVLGRQASPERLEELRTQLGLNRSLPSQYWAWVSNVAGGSLGNSTVALAEKSSTPSLNQRLSSPMWNSLVLAALTAVLMIPLSLLLGALAGARAGGVVDRIISGTSLSLTAMPEFVLGALLLLVFFTRLDWLPPVAVEVTTSGPFGAPTALVLPTATLLGVTVGSGARLVRAGMVEAMRSEYVEAARLSGLSETTVTFRYALRNSLGAAVQILAQNLQYLLGGIIVVESLFAYPGIGSELIQAINTRDTTAIEAIAIVLAAAYIVINIVADLLTVLLVPRLRTEL